MKWVAKLVGFAYTIRSASRRVDPCLTAESVLRRRFGVSCLHEHRERACLAWKETVRGKMSKECRRRASSNCLAIYTPRLRVSRQCTRAWLSV